MNSEYDLFKSGDEDKKDGPRLVREEDEEEVDDEERIREAINDLAPVLLLDIRTRISDSEPVRHYGS